MNPKFGKSCPNWEHQGRSDARLVASIDMMNRGGHAWLGDGQTPAEPANYFYMHAANRRGGRALGASDDGPWHSCLRHRAKPMDAQSIDWVPHPINTSPSKHQKVGGNARNGMSQFDFSAEGVKQSLTRSKERLQREQLELVYLHASDNDLEVLEHTEAWSTLLQAKDAGVISHPGLSKSPAAAHGGLWTIMQMHLHGAVEPTGSIAHGDFGRSRGSKGQNLRQERAELWTALRSRITAMDA